MTAFRLFIVALLCFASGVMMLGEHGRAEGPWPALAFILAVVLLMLIAVILAARRARP